MYKSIVTSEQWTEVTGYQKGLTAFQDNMNKLLEVIFKFGCMFVIFVVGLYVVFVRHSFIYDLKSMWREIPQPADDWMRFYYHITLGYHLHRSCFQFFNPVRKDFWALFLHHWATITLICLSWIGGYLQVGTVVMVLHDNIDVILPLAKICRYLGWNTLKDVLFVLFVASWIVCRNFLFSYMCIYRTYMDYTDLIRRDDPRAAIGWGIMCFLEVLHIYWLYFIWVVMWEIIQKGRKGIDDTRSFSESEGDTAKNVHDD